MRTFNISVLANSNEAWKFALFHNHNQFSPAALFNGYSYHKWGPNFANGAKMNIRNTFYTSFGIVMATSMASCSTKLRERKMAVMNYWKMVSVVYFKALWRNFFGGNF